MGDEQLNSELKQRARQTESKSNDPVAKVQARLLARGASCFKALARNFRIMDDNRDQKLTPEEFATGMADIGVDISRGELQVLWEKFDSDNNGTINVTEFVVALRPKMKAKREDIVRKCFKKMDKTGDGVVTVEDLTRTYDVRHHPKFKSGEWTKNQVLKNYLKTFEAQDNVDGMVTYQEFLDYYACLSACIDNDSYFALMMTNAWGE